MAIAGSEATDARGAVVPALLAEVLGVAQLTQARKVTVDGSTVTIERVTDTGYESVAGLHAGGDQRGGEDQRPAVPVVQGHHGREEQADHRAESLGDLGLDAGEVGLAERLDAVESFENAPPRAAGQTVKDEGDGGVKIADYLASKKLI